MIGRPVRLQWMRADEHGWDPKGPPSCSITAPTSTTRARSAKWEADIFLNEQPMQRSGATLLAATLAKLPKFGQAPESTMRGWGSRTTLPTAS